MYITQLFDLDMGHLPKLKRTDTAAVTHNVEIQVMSYKKT